MKLRKRILAALLVSAMLLQGLPVSALASPAEPATHVPEKSAVQETILPEEPAEQEEAVPSEVPEAEFIYAVPGAAYDLTYTVLTDGTAEITGYTGELPAQLTLPASIDGKTVTGIGESAFNKARSLVQVQLPDTVTYVGWDAFGYCSNLTEVILPDGLTTIKGYAFERCYDLSRIRIPDTVTSIGPEAFTYCASLSSINIPLSWNSAGLNIFYGCSQLVKITIPEEIKALPDNAFCGSNCLKEIVFPSQMTAIPRSAFEGCSSLTQVQIPDTVTSIGYRAFADCTKLSSINIPLSWYSSGGHIFQGCSSLTKITVPESMTSLPRNAFSDADYLQEIVLPSQLMVIPDGAFYGCSALTQIQLPETITSIGESAFSYCTSLTEMVLPPRLTEIPSDTFAGCSALIQVRIPDTVTSIGYEVFQDCISLSDINIPLGWKRAYKRIFQGCSSLTTITVPEGMTSLPAYAFSDADCLQKVVLPESLSDIGQLAFQNCTSLSSINIPLGWIRSGGSIFKGCSSLTKITMPEDRTSLPRYAFSDADYLQEIVLPSQLMAIPDGAFQGCTGLTQIQLPETITSIGEHAFQGCTGLTQIHLPDGITDLGDSAFAECTNLVGTNIPLNWTNSGGNIFKGCNSLTRIEVPEGLQTLPNRAFKGCESLGEIVLPATLQTIGDYAFMSCSTLRSIALPNGLKTIGAVAFANCTGLTSVHIPDSVTSLLYGAFHNCRNLSSVNIPLGWNYAGGDAQTAGGSIFKNCSSLKEMTVPEGLTALPDYAFAGCNELTAIHLPQSLRVVGNYAFWDCSGLTALDFPDSVETIGQAACYDCPSLNHVHLPQSWNQAGVYILKGCLSLHTVALPEGLIELPDNAFGYADTLQTVVLPDSMTRIGSGAFESCVVLKHVWIGKNVTYIADNSFNQCAVLTIHGAPGSFAQTYAQQHGIPFSTEPVRQETEFLRGRVQKQDGTGEADVNVYLYDITDHTVVFDNLHTAADGSWSTSAMKAGHEYIVRYYKSGCHFSQQRITFTAPEADFILEPVTVAPIDGLVCREADFTCRVDPETAAAVITAYTGTDTDIMIPAKLDGRPVFVIDSNAFLNNTTVKTVVLPEGITKIEASAFKGCTGLTEITFPNRLSYVGEYAFENCSSLTALELPDSLEQIRYKAFSGCITLNSVQLPVNWIAIGSSWEIKHGYVFNGCTALTRLTVPHGMQCIPEGAFAGCSALTQVQIPETVTSMEDRVFTGCANLSSIDLPDKLTEIPKEAFAGCSALTQVQIPDTVTSIGFAAFADCTSLSSINIPLSWKSSGGDIFQGCSSLTKITVPEGMTSLPSEAFSGADCLQKVVLPESLSDIGQRAFQKCTSLSSINIPLGWKKAGSRIFEGCSSLTKITVPEGMTSLPSEAFYGADCLQEIVLPSQLTAIPFAAFGYCSALTQVQIPDTVTSIGGSAFAGCENLSSVKLPNKLTEIPYNAFGGCSALTQVQLPGTVTNIGKYAFDGCSTLTQVQIPDTVTSIGCAAFAYCTGLSSINIPLSWNWSGGEIFYGCSSLKKVTVPEGIQYLPDNAFSGCQYLTEIILPETLTGIGSQAFYNCSSLEMLRIGKAVTSADGTIVFSGCPKLVIHCYANSFIHQYAEKNHIPCKLIDDHVHVFETVEERAPSCTRDGLIRSRCSVCGFVRTETVPALGHDFDDWIIVKPASYRADGIRTRTCRRCGETESRSIPALTFDASDPKYGMANFTVVNAQTQQPLSGAHICVASLSGQGEETFTTDDQGRVSIVLPVGANAVSCYYSGCIARNLNIRVEPGENAIPAVGLSALPAYEAKLDSHLMTENEILSAGIDKKDVGNQNVYAYELKLTFTPTLEIFTLKTFKTESGQILKGIGSGSATWVEQKDEDCNGYFWIPDHGGTKIVPITEYFYLIVRGEIRWQKEMFDVEMLVVNNSLTDTMENLTAELEIPQGLSLAAMVDAPQKPLQTMETIAGGQSRSVHWYLRGDKAGSYDLKAHLKGKLMPFEEPIDDTFIASNQLQVWSEDALRLDFEFPNAAYYGQDYPVKISLTNVSDIPLYNVTHAVRMIQGMEIYHEENQVKKKLEEGSYASWLRVLKPGDKLIIEGSANIFFESEIMEKKIQKMIDVVDGMEFLYRSVKLVKVFTGDISSAADLIKTLCTTLEDFDRFLGDDMDKEQLAILKEISGTVKDMETLFKTKKKKNGAAAAGKVLMDPELQAQFQEFNKDPAKWIKEHSKEELKDFKDKLKAIKNLSGKLKPGDSSSGDFDIFDSIRTAIASIPVRFCLTEIIMTENPDNSVSIPWEYHVSPASAPYSGVGDPDKYIQSLVHAALGEVYNEVAPSYLNLIPGLDDPLQQDEAIRYIQTTETEIAKVKAKDATGKITFRVWVRSGPTVHPASAAPYASSPDFALSCDQKNAVMENGVLTFKGDATISVQPTAGKEGVLYVEDSNGNLYTYQLNVVPEHTCAGNSLRVLSAPTPAHDGYAVRLCDTCGAVVEVVPLSYKDPCSTHTYGQWVTESEATAQAMGIRSRICSVCGHVEYDFTEFVHTHKLEHHPAIQATCTEDGRIEHWRCTICSKVFRDPEGTTEVTEDALLIPKTGHDFGTEWKTDPQNHWKECCCGEKQELGAHTYGEWIVTQTPTETEPGTRVHHCTICGYSQEEQLPALGMQAITVRFVRKSLFGDKSTLVTVEPGQQIKAPSLGLRRKTMCWKSSTGELSVESGAVITYDQLRAALDPSVQAQEIVFNAVQKDPGDMPEQEAPIQVTFTYLNSRGKERTITKKVAAGKTLKVPGILGRANKNLVWQEDGGRLTVSQRSSLTFDQLKALISEDRMVRFTAVAAGNPVFRTQPIVKYNFPNERYTLM